MLYGSRKWWLGPGGLTSLRLQRIIRPARHKHFIVVLCEQRTTDAAVSAQLLPQFVAALFFTLSKISLFYIFSCFDNSRK